MTTGDYAAIEAARATTLAGPDERLRRAWRRVAVLLVAGFFGAFGEDLEFPLTGSYFCIDPFDVETGVEAGVEVFYDDVPAIGVAGADGAIIGALWSWVAAFGEAQGLFRFRVPEEIFLFEAKPEIVVVVFDERAAVAGMGCTIGVEHFAHDEIAIAALRVFYYEDGLQQAIRGAAGGLFGG